MRARRTGLFAGDDAKRLFLVLCFIVAVTVVVLALAGAAKAHDWYAPQCCNGRDCAPAETVRETREGFVLPDGRVVPLSLRRRSLDGRWHVCDNGAEVLCIYAPDPGV